MPDGSQARSVPIESNCEGGEEMAEANWLPAGKPNEVAEEGTPPRPSSASEYSVGNDWPPAPASPWNGTVVVGGGEEKPQYRCIASMVKRDGHVLAVALAGGLLYTGSESKSVRVWSHPDLVEYSRFRAGAGGVRALAVAESRQMVFSAHRDRKIRVWRRSRSNPTVHRRVGTLPGLGDCLRGLASAASAPAGHADAVTCLAYNAEDDLLYSCSRDKSVKVWRVSDLRCAGTVRGAHGEGVNAVAVGPDGLVVTGSDDSMVRVWRRVVGRDTHVLAMTLQVQYSPVKSLALSPDGRVLYAGSCDANINYWERAQLFGQMRHAGILRGHRHAVLCLAAVENLLLSGSADRTVRVWRREPGDGTLHSCLAVLEGHRGPVRSVAASMDPHNGCLVYSGGLDGMLKVWWASTKSHY